MPKNQFYIRISSFLIPLVLLLISFSINDKRVVSIFSILVFASLCIVFRIMKIKYSSFAFVFTALFFVFHCGYCVLWAFQQPFNESVAKLVSDENWCRSIRFSSLFLILLSLGICLTFRKKNKDLTGNTKLKNAMNYDQIRRIGFIFCVLFIIPRLYIDFLYLRVGYHESFSLSINGFFETFAEGFYIGLLFLLVGYQNNKQKCTILFLLIMLFCAVGMISGRRQEKVVFVLAAVILYLNILNSKKIKLYKILSIGFLLFLTFVLIATFGDIRSGSHTFASFLVSFKKNFSFDLIFDQLEEFGSAGYTLAATVQSFSKYGTGYGANYLQSWVIVFPQVGGVFDQVTANLNFVYQIPSSLNYWLGGSLLGELYYNFGWLSALLFIPFGFFVGQISKSIRNAFGQNHVSMGALASIIIMGPMFLWIRGVFSYIPRTLVWMLLIAVLVNMIFKKSNSQFSYSYNKRGISQVINY